MQALLVRFLAVLLVGFSAAAGAVASAGSASALVSCPTGSRELFGRCVNPNGVGVAGTSTVPSDVPPVRYPSTVLAAANGDGGTPHQNAALAGLNGNDTKLTLAGRLSKVDAATSIVAGGLIGYEVGTQISRFGCFAGADILCAAPKSPDFVPNSDVAFEGDTGWTKGNVVPASGKPWWSNNTAAPGTPMTVEFVGSPEVAGTPAKHPSGSPTFTFSPASPPPFAFDGIVYCLNGQSASSGTAAYVYGDVARVPMCGPVVDGGPPTVPATVLICNFALVACTLSEANAGVPGIWPYRFLGDPMRPPAQPSNPERYYETRRECSGGSSRVSRSPSFKDTDSTWPGYTDPALCPTPEETTSVVVNKKTQGDAAPTRKVSETVIPDPVKLWGTQYPECAGGVCRLGVWKVTPNGTRSCFDRSTDCLDWSKDPNKEDTYRCTYGRGAAGSFNPSQVVALAECKVYNPTFNPQDVAKTKIYADPRTGEIPVGTEPNVPTATTNPNVPVPPPVTDVPPTTGVGSDVCFPSGWGLMNPLEWVLKPVKCALSWAFVPSPGSWDVAGLKAQAESRPPWSVLAGAAAGIRSIASAYSQGGCGVLWSLGGNRLSTCTLDSVPGYSALYGIAQVGLLSLTGLGMFKMVASSVSGRGD